MENEQENELNQWLKEQRIILDLKARRAFSDVLPVAKIVKRSHPRLVDLHNYTPKSSVVLKLQSWQTFNQKVLKKLGINLQRSELEQLASGAPGAIESLFHELIAVTKCGSPRPRPRLSVSPTSSQNSGLIKKLANKKSVERTLNRSLTQVIERPPSVDTPPQVLTMDVNVMVNGQMKKVSKKLVAYEHYAKTVRESAEKTRYINSIVQKTNHLQKTIDAKNERIDVLLQQMAKLSVSILSMPHTPNETDDDTELQSRCDNAAEPCYEFDNY
ncbi:sperm flagellar protein 1 [Drosophila mauritiana]|uniref:Sperm flagellar protein 1 n=1 Tax=Drosophila mauritiana TaxID=7226 RepID=A0A6P8KAK8_DROMA|nr:sperm flagellar protein 1 [Drosophila mauritiana]